MMSISDLSDDSLVELENKLIADLAMVRRVRALLAEHRGLPAASRTTATPSAPMPVEPAPPRPPVKSHEEVLMEALPLMPESGFKLKALRGAVAVSKVYPRSEELKRFIRRAISAGKVVVLSCGTGRLGSTYRCTMPKPQSAAETESNLPVNGQNSAVAL